MARRGFAVPALLLGILLGAQASLADTKRFNIPDTIVTGRDSAPVNVPAMQISGDYRVPENQRGQSPAILILHGTEGVDGRGRDHSAALLEAGFATFEIDMWRPRSLKGGPNSRPGNLAETLPDVFGALDFLARQPEVDPARIGVLGFSWGGALAIWSTSRRINEQYNRSNRRFAAHAALYPLCSAFNGPYAPQMHNLSGAPLALLVANQNAYEPPGTCKTFADNLPEEFRKTVTVTAYEATPGWDARRDMSFNDPYANGGKGGQIAYKTDAAVTEKARKDMIEFFKRTFKMR